MCITMLLQKHRRLVALTVGPVFVLVILGYGIAAVVFAVSRHMLMLATGLALLALVALVMWCRMVWQLYRQPDS